jgi:hypothetical protein
MDNGDLTNLSPKKEALLKNEYKNIMDRLENLRCDLAATWLAIGAMQTVLTAQQQKDVLAAMSVASAKKQVLYDAPLPTPEARMQLEKHRANMQAAEQRLYQLLQHAPVEFQPGKRP